MLSLLKEFPHIAYSTFFQGILENVNAKFIKSKDSIQKKLYLFHTSYISNIILNFFERILK